MVIRKAHGSSGMSSHNLERRPANHPSSEQFVRVPNAIKTAKEDDATPHEIATRLPYGEHHASSARHRPPERPRLSVVVVGYNMARELPRTIRSLSPNMQRDIDPRDYEIILVDNGSTQPFDETELRGLMTNLTIHRLQYATWSPVPAIKFGMNLARGDLIGVCIDGARIASPGLLATALAASRLHARPMIGTLAFHLGPEVQMQSVKHGYNQAVEDALLAQSGWENDGYRLFSVSTFAGSSARGWFELPAESNALFLRAEHWRDLGGWDERFETPGGGLVNLDVWSRVCADTGGELIMLLGEATFHQVHGGIATNNPNAPQALFHEEYLRIRGLPFTRPTRRPLYFGSVPDTAKPSFKLSVDRM
jgi:hypothetical protein